MTLNKTQVCPHCRKKFQGIDQSILPFCSKRCKEVDLNRWLSDYYYIPGTTNDDDESTSTKDTTHEDET